MTEARAAAKRRRARQPTEAAVRLDRPRRRNVDYLQAQRDAERRIETALHAYLALEQQIEQVRVAAQNDIKQIRLRQAIAVWQISHVGHTVQQISELLEIPQKDTRRLLSAGQIAAHQPTPQPTHDKPLPAVAGQPVGGVVHAGQCLRRLVGWLLRTGLDDVVARQLLPAAAGPILPGRLERPLVHCQETLVCRRGVPDLVLRQAAGAPPHVRPHQTARHAAAGGTTTAPRRTRPAPASTGAHPDRS